MHPGETKVGAIPPLQEVADSQEKWSWEAEDTIRKWLLIDYISVKLGAGGGGCGGNPKQMLLGLWGKRKGMSKRQRSWAKSHMVEKMKTGTGASPRRRGLGLTAVIPEGLHQDVRKNQTQLCQQQDWIPTQIRAIQVWIKANSPILTVFQKQK